MKTLLTITGMSCGHCERAAREALLGASGVSSAEVVLATGSAVVVGEGFSVEDLRAAVAGEGFEVTEVREGD